MKAKPTVMAAILSVGAVSIVAMRFYSERPRVGVEAAHPIPVSTRNVLPEEGARTDCASSDVVEEKISPRLVSSLAASSASGYAQHSPPAGRRSSSVGGDGCERRLEVSDRR